jgi:hypothetical protein
MIGYHKKDIFSFPLAQRAIARYHLERESRLNNQGT